VANLPTDIKRLFVRCLAKAAEDAGAALYDTIFAAATDRFTDIKQGRVLVTTSGDGFSGTFSVILPAQMGGFSAPEVAGLCSELLDFHDKAKQFLTVCYRYGLDPVEIFDSYLPTPLPAVVLDPVPTPTDSEIATQMLRMVEAPKETFLDSTYLRLPATRAADHV
jgi:hypothetical protein